MPVTLTWNVLADVKVQDSVELPDPVTLVGARVHSVLFVVRFTIPVNPLTLDTVIVEGAAEPASTVIAVGLAASVKF